MNVSNGDTAAVLYAPEGAPARVPERHGVVAALAATGVVGPILFTVLVIVQGALQPDYSHLAHPVSALAAWPGGWVQNVNFVVFGVLATAYAIGLHLGVRPRRGGVLGPALLVLSGVGLVVAGAFPVSAAGGALVIPVGHIVGTLMAFLGAGAGFVVLSRRLAGDPRWQGLATYALASGLAIIILLFAVFAFARGPDTPLNPWVGLVQRLPMALWFSCLAVLAIRLLRLR